MLCAYSHPSQCRIVICVICQQLCQSVSAAGACQRIARRMQDCLNTSAIFCCATAARCLRLSRQHVMPSASSGADCTLMFTFSLLFLTSSFHAFPLFCCSFGMVICDESHALKSHRTKRCQFVWPFVQRARRAVLISGTPAPSRPIELFPQVSFMEPAGCTALQSVSPFKVQYLALKLSWLEWKGLIVLTGTSSKAVSQEGI